MRCLSQRQNARNQQSASFVHNARLFKLFFGPFRNAYRRTGVMVEVFICSVFVLAITYEVRVPVSEKLGQGRHAVANKHRERPSP